MTPKFPGTITDSCFIPDRPKVHMAYLGTMEGQRVEAIIKKPTKPKTNPQIRYIHGVVFKMIADDFGYDTIAPVKKHLKEEYLEKRVAVSKKRGKEIEYTPSLADVTKMEMAKFIDDCVIWAATWGIVIPDPSEVVV